MSSFRGLYGDQLFLLILPVAAWTSLVMGGRGTLLVRYVAILLPILAPVAAFGSLWNSYILVSLSTKRHALALLLTFLNFILYYKTAFR